MTNVYADHWGPDIERQWKETLSRFTELHPLFAELRLDVTAKRAASHLGLADSRALSAWLRGRHLPPFKILRDWYFVVLMVERDADGDAIARWTLHTGMNPSVYYNFVRACTQSTWTAVKVAGVLSAKQKALQIWSAHSQSL